MQPTVKPNYGQRLHHKRMPTSQVFEADLKIQQPARRPEQGRISMRNWRQHR